MHKRLMVLILWSLVVLTGCMTPNIQDGMSLKANQGLMVCRISTNETDFVLTIIKRPALFVSSAIFEINSKDSLRVIFLPAGEYTWRGLYRAPYCSEFENKALFKIAPGKITYVGDVVLDIDWPTGKYSLDFVDNFNQIEERFKLEYPSFYEQYEFTKSITQDKRLSKEAILSRIHTVIVIQ